MWDKMEVFYHVAKSGSFTKAVDVLNITQSALSRTVFALEEHFGHRLFARNPRGVELTRKGEEVFKAAQAMVMAMEAAKVSVNGKEGVEGKIRIATASSLTTQVFSSSFLRFMEKHPKVQLEIVCNDHFIDIVQNEVDVAIRPYDFDNKEMIQTYLFTMKAGLYASEKYISNFGMPESGKDLDKHRLITFGRPQDNPYGDVEWILRESSSLKRTPLLTVNSVEAMLEAAKEGVGIITSYGAMKGVKEANLIKILPNLKSPEYKLYFAYPQYLGETEKIRVLEEHLLQEFKYLKKNEET